MEVWAPEAEPTNPIPRLRSVLTIGVALVVIAALVLWGLA